MKRKTVCSKHLSDRGRSCVSVEAAPSLSFATPWSRSLCHCPGCPDRSLPSHFRQRRCREARVSVEKEMALHCIIIKAKLIQQPLKHTLTFNASCYNPITNAVLTLHTLLYLQVEKNCHYKSRKWQ